MTTPWKIAGDYEEEISKIVSQLLNMAADDFKNHGCNDFNLPNIPANREIMRGLVKWSGDPDDEIRVSVDGTTIYANDSQLMRYFADQFRRSHSPTATEDPSPA